MPFILDQQINPRKKLSVEGHVTAKSPAELALDFTCRYLCSVGDTAFQINVEYVLRESEFSLYFCHSTPIPSLDPLCVPVLILLANILLKNNKPNSTPLSSESLVVF